MSDDDELTRAMATVPAGSWGVAVSGGADSVALLRLAMLQPQLQLHVIHLDHETRDGGSAADAEFVNALAVRFNLPLSAARISEIKIDDSLNNTSARYRAARLAWFGTVMRAFRLAGVLLAHHLDDQAETVAQRLLRGRQPAGLGGMATDSTIGGVRLLRPLLQIRRAALRLFLETQAQPWVEDLSNASRDYQRNRIRTLLAGDAKLCDALTNLNAAAKSVSSWLDKTSPTLASNFETAELAGLPKPIARHSAGQWLREGGVPSVDLCTKLCDRLISIVDDWTTPSRADFSGTLRVHRNHGVISAVRPDPSPVGNYKSPHNKPAARSRV